jgi:hypothetical protein
MTPWFEARARGTLLARENLILRSRAEQGVSKDELRESDL